MRIDILSKKHKRQVGGWVWRDDHLNSTLQHLCHLLHGRPQRRLLLDAPQGHLHQPVQSPLICQWLCLVLHQRVKPPLSEAIVRPVRQHLLRLPGLCVHISPAADDFQQHDAEAVHIHLGRDRQALEPLGRDVSSCSSDVREGSALVRPQQLGHPEVGDPGCEVVVDEDVLRLDVAVDDLGAAVFVQIQDAPRDPEGELHAGVPMQPGASLEEVEQRAVAHILVRQEPMRPLVAVP
ncbi:hypothetical protein Taro_051918 [Colocasia esculenta]|uniref:Uncharacterized protein n=1 Tax=Colocasia esculenta TaxID=4460 RepID=A0A843XIP6_COLES|nr:hypothetical protein [Colocasia esculenta]